MLVYVARRLLLAVPVVIVITLFAFLILHYAPGDPVELLLAEAATPEVVASLRRRLGLDQPPHIQYLVFVGRLARGDLGISYRTRMDVTVTLLPALRRTLQLAAVAMLIAVSVAVPIGVVSATRRHSVIDYLGMAIAIVGISAPVFWTGIVFIYVFSLRLGMFPSGGAEHWYSIVLPAVVLSFQTGAILARMTRSCMLEVLGQDYVRTARSKGVAEFLVQYKHALRNASLPVITTIGTHLGNMIAGAILVETVFSWPGVGRLMLRAIFERDNPTVQGAIVVMALIFVGLNLLVDLVYSVLNPTIRYA